MTEVESYQWWVDWLKKQRPKFVNQASMARHFGMTQGALSRILAGKRSGMRFWRKQMADQETK
jgi:hypothetical protein